MSVDDYMGMTAGASESACGVFRYHLFRSWASGPRLAFVMLNPSTANASKDDPTIRRCVGFAKAAGCGGIEVVNLFAFRATSPAALRAAGWLEGWQNGGWLLSTCRAAIGGGGKVCAAWGALGNTTHRAQQTLRDLRAIGPVHCLGRTESGAPRHPLYVRGDAPLVLL